LQNKRDELLEKLNKIRKCSEKIVYQMVDGVKDRLEKNYVIVMNATSRPSK
jgi:nicotinamide mononucleotide (NMN) deamidase PncC